MQFLFPWRREIAELKAKLAEAEGRNNYLQRELDIHAAHRSAAKKTIGALRDVIAQGHFRNPATGRLGTKGEVFLGKTK
jgi:hypothetical protein